MTAKKVRTAPREYKGNDPEFLAACERAKVAATNRQYRRFLQHRGQAYTAWVETEQGRKYNALRAKLTPGTPVALSAEEIVAYRGLVETIV